MPTENTVTDRRRSHWETTGIRGTPLFSPGPEGSSKWFRSPFARWPRAADIALTLACLLATVFVVEGPDDTMATRPIGEASALALLICAVSVPALCWRRQRPLTVLAVGLATWAVLLAGDDTHGGWFTILALYAAGRYAPVDWRGAAGVAGATALASVDGLDDPGPWWQVPLLAGLVMSGVWWLGRSLQRRQGRARERQRERAAETRRIVAEERTRIARELHDVVAHRVSLMTVQASGARAVAAQDLQAAIRAMGAVEEAGRQALDELRHLLGVLRPEADLYELGPQPSLADLPRLMDQIRQAGGEVRLVAESVPDGLTARLHLFAYRIIQEALTNVLKHAGPGTPAEVRLCADHDGLVIEVCDSGQAGVLAPGPTSPGERVGGHGIIGMRERALLLGGSLEAGPRPGGGFQVSARLPIGGNSA